MDRTDGRRRWRRMGLAVALATVVAEALMLRRRGYGLAGDVVVRCRRGHLFTTLWVPGVSLTSLRLGWWRYQFCPVGRHWSVVTPARADDLTPDERATARTVHDLALP
jgi:hypothetical protein